MRRRSQCGAQDDKHARQLDLFGNQVPGIGDWAGPTWQVLPEQTRQALTGLMARLLLDHRSLESEAADDVR